MIPIRYENENAVFTSTQINDYGLPENYGFENYIVIESREANLVSDYKYDQTLNIRPIHRYSRFARFKSTFLKLIGFKHTPTHILVACKTVDPLDPWNTCRKILKHYSWRKYYDYIPAILVDLGLFKMLKIESDKVEEIYNDFKFLADKFEREKHLLKRKYFPNIRYIIFKLLEHHGIIYGYDIPLARTKKKLDALEECFYMLLK
jgi:hypothetical protein